jgi:4-oxalocrotonate tautomerase
MPMITVTYATPRAAAGLKGAIAATASRLAAEILGKDPKVTAVLVEEASAEDWFCGGQSLAAAGLASFWLDIRVTDGTNTKDEKAAFVAAAFREMGKLLGPLHEESYCHVHDVRADAYGYGGLTQERRYVSAKLGVPAAA